MDDPELRELEKAMERIWDLAHAMGLDPYPVHFEMVPASIMYEFGAYGLPGRFHHWSHGKAYYRMKMQYDYGLSKIYEMVINTNPSYAFLMENNALVQQKLVVAHVLGHCDFFKHNAYFQHSNRSMVETASLNADRIRQYEFQHGAHVVEEFLDAVLSIQEHIDPHMNFRHRAAGATPEPPTEPLTSAYDDLWSLGQEARQERERLALEAERRRRAPARIPPEPEKDLLLFLLEYGPELEPWQRDIISIVHSEMLYFVPQMQTKIANEGWACATGDSLVLTENGFMRFDQLYNRRARLAVAAGGGTILRRVTDYHKEEQVPTLRLRTHRGLTIEGALQHRVLLADGSWTYLQDVQVGDRIAIELGTEIWPQERQAIHYEVAQPSPTLETVASLAGVSSSTVIRHMKGRRTLQAGAIDAALKTTVYTPEYKGKVLPTRSELRLPATLNADVAWLLGYFVGDGNRTKSGIGFTTGDEELAVKLTRMITQVFGVQARVSWDTSNGSHRWRIIVHSRELLRWLTGVGIDLRDKARTKKIPDLVLRSPKSVMSAFLRGYFDADAYAGRVGVILSSASELLIRTVQIVLLNYGILSTQRPQADGCIQLHIAGASTARFLREIGFSLSRKQAALQAYVTDHLWFKREDPTDTVVAIEHGCADVFDITVDIAHSYVANGLRHHNSFWHARILRDLELTDEEFTEFANLNAGVVSPHRRSINPYHLGLKLLEDIERRWDNPTEEEQVKLGRTPGQGRAKLFEVRELENDVSLIRNYLTKELVEELDLYLYERQGNEWVIVEKDWEKVRDGIISEMTNFGNPVILVEDADYRRNRELYLKHSYEGRPLDMPYAEKTLQYIYRLWGRPVHIETVIDDDPTLISYDGQKITRAAL
jgi:stage V sporulation protein R